MTHASHAHVTRTIEKKSERRFTILANRISDSARVGARNIRSISPKARILRHEARSSSVYLSPRGATTPSTNHPSSSIFYAAGRKRNETDFGPDGGISAPYSSFRHMCVPIHRVSLAGRYRGY